MFVRTITHLKGRHEVRHSKSKLIIDVNKNAETSSIIKNLALSSQPRLAHLQDLSHWLSPRIYSCDKKTYPETSIFTCARPIGVVSDQFLGEYFYQLGALVQLSRLYLAMDLTVYFNPPTLYTLVHLRLLNSLRLKYLILHHQ